MFRKILKGLPFVGGESKTQPNRFSQGEGEVVALQERDLVGESPGPYRYMVRFDREVRLPGGGNTLTAMVPFKLAGEAAKLEGQRAHVVFGIASVGDFCKDCVVTGIKPVAPSINSAFIPFQ